MAQGASCWVNERLGNACPEGVVLGAGVPVSCNRDGAILSNPLQPRDHFLLCVSLLQNRKTLSVVSKRPRCTGLEDVTLRVVHSALEGRWLLLACIPPPPEALSEIWSDIHLQPV